MRKWAFPIACVVFGTGFLAVVAYRYGPSASLEGQVGSDAGRPRGALGYYLRAYDLLPQYPQEPGFADRASSALQKLGGWPPADVSADDLAAAKRFLQDSGPALEMIQRGLRAPSLGWPQWKTLAEATADTFGQWSLPRLRRVGDLLLAGAALAYRDGEVTQAMNGYLDSVEFAGDAGRGGLPIERLFASVWLRSSVKPLLAVLAEPGMSARDLRGGTKRLRRLLAEQEPFAATVRTELPLSRAAMPPAQQQLVEPYMKDISDAARLDYPHWLAFDLSAHWPAPGTVDPTQQPYLPPKMWEGLRARYEEYQAYLRAATIVAALRLYDLDRGQYPDGLVELIPKYVKELPLDPFGAAPFVYRRQEAGWVIQSVGPNAQDDGGGGDDILFGPSASPP